jgi:hypothetical protein
MGFAAPQQLSYQEVAAYSRMTGKNLSPARVRWIMLMDDWFMEAWGAAHAVQPAKPLAPSHQVPMKKDPKTMAPMKT